MKFGYTVSILAWVLLCRFQVFTTGDFPFPIDIPDLDNLFAGSSLFASELFALVLSHLDLQMVHPGP